MLFFKFIAKICFKLVWGINKGLIMFECTAGGPILILLGVLTIVGLFAMRWLWSAISGLCALLIMGMPFVLVPVEGWLDRAEHKENHQEIKNKVE